MAFVFHGSPVQNLTEIQPRKNGLVYAVKDKIICAMFMASRSTGHGVYSRSIGHEDGIPFLVERYKAALENLYNNVSGSIYVLDDQDFVQDKLKWQMVSKRPQAVVQEIKIDNVQKFLFDLAAQGQLKIYRWPSRPKRIPDDDSDLVQTALSFNNAEKVEEFKSLFPDLYGKHKQEFDKITQVQNKDVLNS